MQRVCAGPCRYLQCAATRFDHTLHSYGVAGRATPTDDDSGCPAVGACGRCTKRGSARWGHGRRKGALPHAGWPRPLGPWHVCRRRLPGHRAVAWVGAAARLHPAQCTAHNWAYGLRRCNCAPWAAREALHTAQCVRCDDPIHSS